MKELIKRLREQAQENINDGQLLEPANLPTTHCSYQEGVLISNKQAMDIANALEQMLFPEAVSAAIARLNYTELDNTLQFAAIDKDLGFYCFDSKPVKNKKFGFWVLSGSTEKHPSLRAKILDPFKFTPFEWEQMLFQRTENGWKWIGNPENENNKNI